MNNLVLVTQGSFETTELSNNGMAIDATELMFVIQAGRDAFGNPMPGGLGCGVAQNIYLRLCNISSTLPVFPGSVEFYSPGYEIRVENAFGEDPAGLIVWVNGVCVNNELLDLAIEINADTGAFSGYLSLYDENWVLPDQIEQVQLF